MGFTSQARSSSSFHAAGLLRHSSSTTPEMSANTGSRGTAKLGKSQAQVEVIHVGLRRFATTERSVELKQSGKTVCIR